MVSLGLQCSFDLDKGMEVSYTILSSERVQKRKRITGNRQSGYRNMKSGLPVPVLPCSTGAAQGSPIYLYKGEMHYVQL